MATNFFLLFILLSHVATSLSENCHPEDEKILLQIKKELNNPTILSSWKPNTGCCYFHWYGVDCSTKTNRVNYLHIRNDTNLVSQFPLSIGNLSYLESLYLDQLPNLTGPIPIKPISKLKKLKTLTISSTGISGPIPNFPTQLKNLAHIDLSSNHLNGTLPLILHQFPKLNTIHFYNNKLTGSIPSSYGYLNNKNLPALLLSHNRLSGKLPMSLGRLNTSVVDLSHNTLEGDASMFFGSNKATVSIYLSRNQFAFDLGKVELSKTLTNLDVSQNKIYGKLPLGMENIESLNVSYNRLCGEIPKGGNMRMFNVSTYFHNKCLCGSPLPSCNRSF